MSSNSTLQLIFKKLPHVKCWYSIKEEYPQLSVKDTSFFQLHVCVKPDFFYIIQPKHHMATGMRNRHERPPIF